jgi:hypothetical protein
MFNVIAIQGGNVTSDWLAGIRLGTLAFSFISLAAFGSYLLVVSRTAQRLILLVPLGLEGVWVFGLIILKGHFALPILWNVADVWTRYSLAIPAALLAAIGLVVQQRVFRKAGLISFGRDALWAAVAFGWYGLVGQLFVQSSPLPPSNIVNDVLFSNFSGIPIQLFRAVMAGVAIADLRPSHLDDLGLSSAMRWYANTLQERVKLDVHVEIFGEERVVASPVKIALFRIAQEALTNVLKHAQAKTARVTLTYGEKSVQVRVTDDGKGFDMDTAGSAKRVSWGLKGMEERTSLLGGRFEVQSQQGQGTTVEVSIPYLQEEADENSPAAGG